jgi:arylsulfatase A-like enzyme
MRAILTGLLALLSSWVAAAADHPNIILVMTDDQGYGDLACHGNPIIQTPHIDAFYKQAARFTDFHVSPTCSPTRSALMTGRHEFKNGVTHTINERERLTLKAFTTAQLLKSAGYTTGIWASTRSSSTARAASARPTSEAAATRRTTSTSTRPSCTTASSRRPPATAPTYSSARP